MGFVTHSWDLSPCNIARIYGRDYRSVFLKPELNVRQLLNYAENGVKIQLSSGRIRASLLLVYMKIN